MPITSVLLDLDDTLCDTIGCRQQRLETAIAGLCRDYPRLDGAALVRRAMESVGEPRSVQGLGAVLEDIGLANTPAGREALQMYATDYAALSLFPDVLPTLRKLSQTYLLGIISNGEEWYQRDKLHHLGLAQYVPELTLSGTVGYEKPDPRIFARALRGVGVRPEAAVFVGDRLEVDIRGAQSAGLHAIWFNHWGGQMTSGSPHPDRIITRFAALPSALAELEKTLATSPGSDR